MSERGVHTEVLRAFVDAQQLWHGAKGEHVIFYPPWFDRMPNGKLGASYSAISPVTGAPVRFDQANAEYNEGRYTGSAGLFDHEEDQRMRAGAQATPKEKRIVERYDTKKVTDYMARRGHLVAKREAEVFVAFWVEGRSYPSVARHLGLAISTVRDLVKKLRVRVK